MHRRRRALTLLASLALLALTGCVLAGCAPSCSESVRVKPAAQPVCPQVKTNPDIPVTENVVYGTAGEVPLVLDICFHPEAVDGAAGGNLAALIGVDGSGPLTTGSRVAAVAELSGPSKLTAAGLGLGTTPQAFQQVELDYLGCAGFGDCPQVRAASPRYHVDESDPLFFIGQSLDERIPKPQSDALVAALRKAGVDTDYVTVKGDRHSIAMLTPELRSRIVASLHTQLGN